MFACIKSSKMHFRAWYCNARFFTSYVVSSDAPKFENRVGLTVHTQLNIQEKLDLNSMRKRNFFSSQKDYLFDDNLIALSNLKGYCLEAGVLAALACNCSINDISETMKDFYFVGNEPDAQFQNIASNGYISFVVPYTENQSDSYQHTCNLKHLKLKYNHIDDFHVKGVNNFTDLPHVSIAHLEFVFEPDLNNGTEAACLIEELISIFKRLDIYPCEIEGNICVDFTISVISNGHTYGFKTGVEQVKNPIFIQRVIDYEVQRQMLHFYNNNLSMAETELVGCNTINDVSMQDKEKFSNYFCVDASSEQHTLNIACLQEKLPVLPESERAKLAEVYKIPLNIADKLVKSDGLSEVFKFIVSLRNDKSLVYNFLLNNVLHKLNSRQMTFEKCGLSFVQIAEIVQLLHSIQISLETADDILEMLLNGDERSAKEIVESYNWYLISDESILEELCNMVLSRHTTEARKLKRFGRRHHMNFLFNALREITNRASRLHAEKLFMKLIHKKKTIAEIDLTKT